MPPISVWLREAREVAHLAAPLALSHLSYMAIMLTDVVMMGWIGTDAIAAGSLARDFFWVLGAFSMGVLTGATPIMAQHLGARRFSRIRPAVRNAAWLALALTIPVSVAAWFSSPILVALGQDPQVSDDGQAYLRWLLWGLLPSLWFAVLTEFLAAHTRPRAVFVVTLFGIALNALLDYAFMFGNFGAPGMGLQGAGVASLVVNWCMFLALLAFVLQDRQFRRYRLLRRAWRIELPVMAEIARVGSPIAVTEIAEMGMFFVTTLMMGLLGVDALAAHAVTAQCYAVVFMIPVGLAQAAAVRVGRATGARDGVRLARSGWTATALAGLLVLLPVIVFWLADHFMPNKPVGEDASDEPVHESWTTLAAFASLVPRIGLGHMVSCNTYRHPAVTAKMAAQIDIISGGRFILGLGAGWQENEHHAYGIHFGTVKERMDRFEEACRLITELFRSRKTSFTGKHYRLVDAPLEPKPIQAPLPLMIGGGGEKRTLRITARYANEWNVWGTPQVMVHKQSVLDAHCNDVGRDPSEIQRSACTLLMMTEDRDRLGHALASGRAVLGGSNDEIRQTVQAYVDAGVDELIIPDFTLGSNARQRTEQMDRFVEEIVPEFR